MTDNRGGYSLSSCVLNSMVWVHTCIRLFVIPWTVARQVPLQWNYPSNSTGVGCWSTPGDLPDTWIKPLSLASPALADRFFFFTTVPPGRWRGEWQPTPVFLPGESHGERNLVVTVHEVTKCQTRLSDWACGKPTHLEYQDQVKTET